MQDVACTVNTQHDCWRYKCQTTGVRYVYQERMRTEKTTSVVEHLTEPNDLILNTAQMHDAPYVQKFRIASTPLDEERVIHESVARAINQRKSVTDRTSGNGRGRGRGGRGRGLGHGSDLVVDRLEGSSGHGRARGRGRGTENMLSGDMVAGEGSSRGGGRGRLVQPGELILDFNRN